MRISRIVASTAIALSLSLGLVACGSDNSSDNSSDTTSPPAASSGGSSSGSTVSIKDFAFHPGTLTVAAGTTVEVTNDDSTTHTWTADDKSWDSGDIAAGSSAEQLFDEAGTFSYHCNIHESMKGTIVVE